jgi:hypothetical protein
MPLAVAIVPLALRGCAASMQRSIRGPFVHDGYLPREWWVGGGVIYRLYDNLLRRRLFPAGRGRGGHCKAAIVI